MAGKKPKSNDVIVRDEAVVTFGDLAAPPENVLRKAVEDLLDRVVMEENIVTRREEQLDQLCNVLLLKLESDRLGQGEPTAPVFFRPRGSPAKTALAIKERFRQLVEKNPETFTTDRDRQIRFSDATLARCVDRLFEFRLIGLGAATVSVAFQVLRSEALKQGEGQYFTPAAVIRAGIRLMRIQPDDMVLDPACGTGGFLIEAFLEMQRTHPRWSAAELAGWAQAHLYGIEKDAIGLKLTKAILQIAGNGAAHCGHGDSVRVRDWPRDFPHLGDGPFDDNSFSVVVTNPPFGENLKVSAQDCRSSGLDIAQKRGDAYCDTEIGLVFLQRAHQLSRVGGRIGIVLPETYFFSSNYSFLFDWLKGRLRPIVVANIPIEAFQGFCRAKTNFYVFEKIA